MTAKYPPETFRIFGKAGGEYYSVNPIPPGHVVFEGMDEITIQLVFNDWKVSREGLSPFHVDQLNQNTRGLGENEVEKILLLVGLSDIKAFMKLKPEERTPKLESEAAFKIANSIVGVMAKLALRFPKADVLYLGTGKLLIAPKGAQPSEGILKDQCQVGRMSLVISELVEDFCTRYQESGKDVKVTPSTGKRTWGRMLSFGDLWEGMDLRNDDGEYVVDTDGQMTKTGAVRFCQLLKRELSKLSPQETKEEAGTDYPPNGGSPSPSAGKFSEDQGAGQVQGRASPRTGPKFRNNTPPRYRWLAGPKFRSNTPPAFLGHAPEVETREGPAIGKDGLLGYDGGSLEVGIKAEPVSDGEEVSEENEGPEYYPWKW